LAGLDLRFETHGRAPRLCYPTHGFLLSDGGAAEPPASYLATEELYQVVRDLQLKNLILPIVGNLAGTRSLAAIGDFLERRATPVSAFYTSNVEFYLVEDGVFGQFAENLEGLPTDTASVIVRSVFSRGRVFAPGSDEACSFQSLQRLDDLLEEVEAGGYIDYNRMVTGGQLPLR